MGPERRVASTGLPGGRTPLGSVLFCGKECADSGGRPRREPAQVVVIRAHRRCERRWTLPAAAGAGKFSHRAQTLPAPPLSDSLDSPRCFEPRWPGRGSPPPRRTQAQKAGKLGLGWETLLLPSHSHPPPPRPFSQSPSPRHPPASTKLQGCARLRRSSDPAFAWGVGSVSSLAPGSD